MIGASHAWIQDAHKAFIDKKRVDWKVVMSSPVIVVLGVHMGYVVVQRHSISGSATQT